MLIGPYSYMNFLKSYYLLFYRFMSYFKPAQFRTEKNYYFIGVINLSNINLYDFYCICIFAEIHIMLLQNLDRITKQIYRNYFCHPERKKQVRLPLNDLTKS